MTVSQILQRYSSFSYKRQLITDGRIILLDQPLEQQLQEKLKLLDTKDGKELLFLENSQLINDTEMILKKISKQNRKTLFVFPGNGSKTPRERSQAWRNYFATEVYAKRFWQPGTDPIVLVGTILPDIFLVMSIEAIVVLDDVISSGSTMKKVRENNAWRFPNAKWFAVSWVAQIPQTKSISGIKGYERVITACVVGKTNGMRTPVNSISTLRQDQTIATSYAQRHFCDPDAFLRLIK